MRDEIPKICIQRTGSRGYQTWRVWVSAGIVRFEREHGTYAWTEEGARRKGQKLLAKWHRQTGNPVIEVDPS